MWTHTVRHSFQRKTLWPRFAFYGKLQVSENGRYILSKVPQILVSWRLSFTRFVIQETSQFCHVNVGHFKGKCNDAMKQTCLKTHGFGFLISLPPSGAVHYSGINVYDSASSTQHMCFFRPLYGQNKRNKPKRNLSAVLWFAALQFMCFSRPVRWGLLDFMSGSSPPPPSFLPPPPSFLPPLLPPPPPPSPPQRAAASVFPAGPQPRPSEPSVPCRTSTSEHMSEHIPERLSEDMSERRSDRMAESLSEIMAERMSENMPERMSD